MRNVKDNSIFHVNVKNFNSSVNNVEIVKIFAPTKKFTINRFDCILQYNVDFSARQYTKNSYGDLTPSLS